MQNRPYEDSMRMLIILLSALLPCSILNAAVEPKGNITSGFENHVSKKVDLGQGKSVLLEAKDPIYSQNPIGYSSACGFSIVDGQLYRCVYPWPRTILSKGVFYIDDQAITLDVSGIGDPWGEGDELQPSDCYVTKLNLNGQVAYILRIAFFNNRDEDFYLEWEIYNGHSQRTAIVSVEDVYPDWYKGPNAVNKLTVSKDDKTSTLHITIGEESFDIKYAIKGVITTYLEVPQWDTIFVGVQTSPSWFEILAISKKDRAVSQVDLNSHYYADDSFFPLENEHVTHTLTPLKLRKNYNGLFVCSTPAIHDPNSGSFDRFTILSIGKAENGKFEGWSNH